MDIRIDHRTEYIHDRPAPHSIRILRLTPRSNDGQRIAAWSVSGNGRRDLPSVEDAFGNRVHTFSIAAPHDRATVAVSGEARTEDTAGVLRGLVETLPPAIYLRETDLTRPDDAIRDLAAPLAARAAADPLDAAHLLMGAVRAAVDYETGRTDARTTAAEALAAGRGVCQDHAHVLVACARLLGLPARYVSGYLAAEDAEPEGEASHAWAEILVEGLGWVGFDAANRVCPTERYVRLAHALDYFGAAPVIGARRGGGTERMEVSVRAGPAGRPPAGDSGQ